MSTSTTSGASAEERSETGRQREEDIREAAALVPTQAAKDRPPEWAFAAVLPFFERTPLRDLLSLCQTDRKLKSACVREMDHIVKRVKEEFPGLPTLTLGRYATDRTLDVRLRKACV